MFFPSVQTPIFSFSRAVNLELPIKSLNTADSNFSQTMIHPNLNCLPLIPLLHVWPLFQ